MAAPEGNQFWKFRSTHGREKIFKTPAMLWKAACKYFEWCEANPLIELQFHGKDAIECKVPKMRPFTMQGLCLYLNCNTKYFNDFEYGLEGKTDDLSKDFSEIITRIRETIYNQKFTGSACGFLNANIIARDLGLVDKKEVDQKTELSSEEREQTIREIMERIKKK